MKINIKSILERLDSFGIELEVVSDNFESESGFILKPVEIDFSNGFRVVSKIKWRTVVSNITFGTYSLNFLKILESSSLENKVIANSYLFSADKHNSILKFEINNISLFGLDVTNWPTNWENLKLEISSKPIDIENYNSVLEAIQIEQESIFGFVFSLLPIQEISETINDTEFESLPEGAKSLITVNKYERSKANRLACISYHGMICQICGFDFEKIYGILGKGFIHVHHIIPLSQLSNYHYINPIKDLIPVCPNCHYMLHKEDPPLLPEKLKELLKSNN